MDQLQLEYQKSAELLIKEHGKQPALEFAKESAAEFHNEINDFRLYDSVQIEELEQKRNHWLGIAAKIKTL